MTNPSFSILSNFDAFLTGMQLEHNKNSKKYNKLEEVIKQVTDDLDSDFRAVYDNLMPNVHILDADYTAKLLLRDISINPTNYFSKFIEEDGQYVDVDNTTSIPVVLELLTDTVKKNIRDKIVASVKLFHSKLPKSTGNPLEVLNEKMKDIHEDIIQYIGSDNVLQDVITVKVTKAGQSFKKEIDLIFGKNALLGLEVPELGSSDTRFVFFGKNFSGMKTRINADISSALKKALSESTKISSRFAERKEAIAVGAVVHFAHTGLKNGAETFLNSPAYAKLIFNTANNPTLNTRSPFSDTYRASNHFKKKTGHTKVALEVTKTYGEKTGILMQLGLTFTTDHSASLNLAMGTRESKISSGLYGSAAKASEALRQYIKARGTREILLKLVGNSPEAGTSSPSLIDLLNSSLLEILNKGSSIKKKTRAAKSKDITFSYIEPSKAILKSINTKLVKSATNKVAEVSTTKKTSIRVTNLVSLQNLINQNLAKQIQNNMGTGSSRRVLNYRSGRFANSAKVERMTESRAGMITAFYSYMRNPYGTFAEGGAQESPASRNPKNLIATSIRELAGAQVANRMRAVLV